LPLRWAVTRTPSQLQAPYYNRLYTSLLAKTLDLGEDVSASI